jgi:hypothetical protein
MSMSFCPSAAPRVMSSNRARCRGVTRCIRPTHGRQYSQYSVSTVSVRCQYSVSIVTVRCLYSVSIVSAHSQYGNVQSASGWSVQRL